MKNLYLSLGLFLVSTVFCFGQEVASKQKMLVTKITATWCPNCGTSAWDRKQEIVNDFKDDVVFLSTHISSSSKLHSAIAEEYAGNLPNVAGQPLFYINRTKYNTSSIVGATQDMKAQNSGKTPLANAGLQMRLDGQAVEVKAKVQFFQPANGEYYLSLFIVEDKVVENQSNRGSDAVHSKIFRGSVAPSTFGELIVNGAVEANQTYDIRLKRAISDAWNTDNIEIAAVIWEKNGDTYDFVNVESVAEFTSFTSINPLEKEGVLLSVNPTTLINQSTVQLTLPSAKEAVSLNVINSNGQLVKQLFTGNLPSGVHSYSMTKGTHLSSGVYFVQLEQGGSSITKRVVVQ